MNLRIGQGYDIHRLVPDRRLMLGGVEIPSDLGEEAHSDGDVLIHAIIDAMLGAACLGDIGHHFPPSSAEWKDASSLILLERVSDMIGKAGWTVGNVDSTVILERPKLGPHIDSIRASLAKTLAIPEDAVSVKAKTNEGEDSAGTRRSVIAHAAVLLLG